MSIWPFRRRKAPAAPPEPPMIDRSRSEDWRVGDLAVCVLDNWNIAWPENPKVNDVLLVSAIGLAFNAFHPGGFIGLGFVGKNPSRRWKNTAFRKANIDREPGTMSVVEMIRRATKVPQPQEI